MTPITPNSTNFSPRNSVQKNDRLNANDFKKKKDSLSNYKDPYPFGWNNALKLKKIGKLHNYLIIMRCEILKISI